MSCFTTEVKPEELLRVVSEYGPVLKTQIVALFPGAANSAIALISELRRNGRLTVGADGYVSLPASGEQDQDREAALWVLISFIGDVRYHSISEYPITVAFFAKDEMYEVAVVHEGQETLVNHAFWSVKEERPPRRLVVVDNPRQARHIKIPNTVAYCTVSADGDVKFYQGLKN